MNVHCPPRSKSNSPFADIVEGFRFASETGPIRALLAFARSGKPGRNALHSAHAGFRGSNLARRSQRPRHFDGVHWNWRTAGCGHARLAFWSERLGQVNCDYLRKFRRESLLVLVLSQFLAFRHSLVARWFLDDAADGQFEYLIQTMVPDALRGRVMALYSMMFMGMAPFGALLGGAMADRVGAPITVAIGAVASVIGATLVWIEPSKNSDRSATADHCAIGRGRGTVGRNSRMQPCLSAKQ